MEEVKGIKAAAQHMGIAIETFRKNVLYVDNGIEYSRRGRTFFFRVSDLDNFNRTQTKHGDSVREFFKRN